jgi:hypothetical protein
MFNKKIRHMKRILFTFLVLSFFSNFSAAKNIISEKNNESESRKMQSTKNKHSEIKTRFKDFFVGEKYGWKPFYQDLSRRAKLNISARSIATIGLATYLSATQGYYGYKLLKRVFNLYNNSESLNEESSDVKPTYYDSLDMGSGNYNPFASDYNLFSKYDYKYNDVRKALSENTARNNIGDVINAFVGEDGVLKQPEVYWPLTFWIQTKLFMFGEKIRPYQFLKKTFIRK